MTGSSFRRGCVYLGLVGALVSFTASLVVFPAGSPVVDERVYVQEGRALAEGDLVLPPTFLPDHQPFFTAPNERGELVFKYTHAWPSVLAASYRLFGTERPVTALAGAAGPLVVVALALALSRRRTTALVAGALVVANPLWVVLSATYLSYAFTSCVGLGCVALVLHALDGHRTRRLVGAGVLAGVAAWARPFDALIVLVPVVVTLVVVLRRRRVGVVGSLGAFALGCVPGVVALLAVNHRVTGSAFHLAFDLVSPRDDLGFGGRSDTLTGSAHHYGPRQAVEGLRDGVLALVRWTPGHLLALGLGAVGIRTLPRGRAWLAGSYVVAFPVAYLAAWGSWNAGSRSRIVDVVGPIYYLPTALVLTVLVAAAITRPRPIRRRLGLAGVGVVGVIATVAALGPAADALGDSRTQWLADEREVAALTPDEPAVVLLESTIFDTEPALGFSHVSYNDVGLDSRTIYGIARSDRVGPVARQFAEREVVYEVDYYVLPSRPGAVDHVDALGFGRDRVTLHLGRHALADTSFVVAVTPGYEPDEPVLYVATASSLSWQSLDTGQEAVVSPAEIVGMALFGDADGWTTMPSEGLANTICLGVSDGPPLWSTQRDEACFPVTDDGLSQLLAPPWTRTAIGPEVATMAASDVSDHLTVAVVSAAG